MNITDVIISPLITEKTHILRADPNKPKISFIVARAANKLEIKQAFFAIFGIKAMEVNTLIRKPQPTRMLPKSRVNYTKTFKIAHITVSQSDLQTLQTTMSQEQQPPQ